MQKRTETWGERMANEARRVVARHRPQVPALGWLTPFVRRLAAIPSPAARFARVEPSASPIREAPAALDDGFPIPLDVRERLRDVIGPGLERARVHDHPGADALARSHHADAITIGDDVFFRAGQYRPHEERGLALLAHEATHVVEGASPSGSQRSFAAGVAAEEARARVSEAKVLSPARAAPLPSSPPFASASPSPGRPSAPAPVAASAPAVRPMAADMDRPPATAGAPAQPLDLAELKRSIYRDLLQQIRSDAERGG